MRLDRGGVFGRWLSQVFGAVLPVPVGIAFGRPCRERTELMLDYLKYRNEYAELLEKKAPPEQSSAAAARSSAKLREMHALPQDRQLALQRKYQKEWDAAKARVEKAITAGQP